MRLWNRKGTRTRPGGMPGADGPSRWYTNLRSPRAVRQLAVLVGFFAAVLLIVELPHPPLPVYLGQKTAHPILARVDFDYVDHEVTANVKSLVALLRVPGLYTPDARQVASLRENLLAMVGEAAKAASLEQVPEAARTEWKLAPETFAALKQALGDKPENLAAVREAVTKALAPLADPIALPIVREEDYQRAVQRLNNIKDLRNKLPAGLSPEAAPMPEEPAAVIIVLSPQGDQTLPLKGVLMQTQTEPIQARIERLIEDPLVPIFGNKGISALAAAMAPRVGPTLVYDQAQTENRRVEAKKDVQDVRILHKANTTLVDAGEEINEGTLQVLKQEQAARIAQLGWVRTTLAWIGAAVVLALLVFLLADYTMRFQPNIGRSFPRSLMLALLCLLVIGVAKWVAQGRGPAEFYTFLLVVAGLIVTITYSQPFALAVTGSMILLVAIATRADLDWAVTAAVGSTVAILSLDAINNRSKLIKVGALAGAVFFAARAAMAFWRMDSGDPNLLTGILYPSLLYLCVGVAAGVVMLAILPYIERAFGITTNISLLELCDVNQPALRRMALEAPGTYTHSLLIGSLAEAAAHAIGAGGLLARVGAYFHDIGKAGKPQYFGENLPDGRLAHQDLQPSMSRLIIMNHVKDGLDMADRLGLPPVIRQFIAEHHGTTLMEYFYREARRLAAAAGRDPPLESEYRYPGPKPHSRETAIVMLADAAEGAARSLQERSAPKIGATVREIVMKRLLDGQLDASSLTVTDLHTVEETLTKTLLSVYHGRVPYPADRLPGEGGAGGETARAAGKGTAGPGAGERV